MELMFIGADHEVTGSCHYLRVGEKNILVDYGMEQGANVFENCELPVDPALIDYVFLTHAHAQAAGIIHTDFEKGFIRAEVIKYDDYVTLGSEAAVKEAGKMGVEGKEYIVQDGDVMHFRFNV